MEKSEMMKRYEEEMGKRGIEVWHFEYIAWLESKGASYDRIMSGGKKTLKEWANMFGMVVAIDQNGEVACFEHIPVMCHNRGEGIWTDSPAHFGEEIYLLPPHLIDFDGDWKDSLTLPDGWGEAQFVELGGWKSPYFTSTK